MSRLVAESALSLLLLGLLSSSASESLSHPLFPPSGLATTHKADPSSKANTTCASLQSGSNIIRPLKVIWTLLIPVLWTDEKLLSLGGALLPHGSHYLHLPTLAYWSINSTFSISSSLKTAATSKCCPGTSSSLTASSHHLVCKLEKATLFALRFRATEKVSSFVGTLLPHSPRGSWCATAASQLLYRRRTSIQVSQLLALCFESMTCALCLRTKATVVF